MKQVVFVSALVLIMILAFGGNTSSKMHPENYQSLRKPGGDDHPWGGEQWTDADPNKTSQPRIPTITAFPLIDYFFVLYLDRITAGADRYQIKSGTHSVRITSSNRNIVGQDNNNQESSIRR